MSAPKWVLPAGQQYPSRVFFSPLDLIMPKCHISVLLAFQNAPKDAASRLESALPKVLGYYPELAGAVSTRSSRNAYVNLSSKGLAFVEADFSANDMDEYLANSFKSELDNLTPTPYASQDGSLSPEIPGTFMQCGALALSGLIKQEEFADDTLRRIGTTPGGMVLGMNLHHQILDGIALYNFLDNWSASVRTGVTVVAHPPLHDRSMVMAPVNHALATSKNPQPVVTIGKFQKDSLANVRLQLGADDLRKLRWSSYTIVESLSAHVWKVITKVRGLPENVTSTMLNAVDCRKAIDLPRGFLGNAIVPGLAYATVHDLVEKPTSYAASLVRSAVKSALKKDYVRAYIESVHLRQQEQQENLLVGEDMALTYSPGISVSSWTNLPFYKLDFGFGTPVYAGPDPAGPIPSEGVVVIGSRKQDGSQELFVSLKCAEVVRFTKEFFRM